MFSKIFSKGQKTKGDKKETTAVKQQQQQQTSSSSSSLEVSPHHIYYPLQLQQQYPQLYQQQQQQIYDQRQKPNLRCVQQQQQQQQQQHHSTIASTTTTTSLDSLFHPSKLVTNLTESPGRSRKLRKEFGGGGGGGDDDDDDDGEVDNNIVNETTEHFSAQQPQQPQLLQVSSSPRDGKATPSDVITEIVEVPYTTNNHNSPGFNVTVQQCPISSPIYNFPPNESSGSRRNEGASQKKNPQISPGTAALLGADQRSPTPRSNPFRNSSQQDLQQFDLLQQNTQQHQQQSSQLLLRNDKEAKFFPVRYRSLSAGDQTNFVCESSEFGKPCGKIASKVGKWRSECDERWGVKGERLKGGGLMWGSARKGNQGGNQTVTPKSTSSEQFYRSIIGQIFLICGKEMKRCVLLQKISSIDAVRQIFSQAFADRVRIEDFHGSDPPVTVYILDTVAAVFYELEDFREVKNLSVLKIFEKKAQQSNKSSNKITSPFIKKLNKLPSPHLPPPHHPPPPHHHHHHVQTSSSMQLDAHQQVVKTDSVQSLPPMSPHTKTEFDGIKIKSRDVCCFGGVVGYQKLPKRGGQSSASKHQHSETADAAKKTSGQAKVGQATEGEGQLGVAVANSALTKSDACQSRHFYSLDRYHSSGCHNHHHHHHHHRTHKKTKSGSQSASASPSSDNYSQYPFYGPQCGCCRHHCACSNHYQRCPDHHHHHYHQQPQSPAKSKSPLKTAQQPRPPNDHQTCFTHHPQQQQRCSVIYRSLPDAKAAGTGTNNCLLPVDLLNTTSCINVGDKISLPHLSTGDGSSSSSSELETRMRISQLEDQLASLTQWVQDSIESESLSLSAPPQNVEAMGEVAANSGRRDGRNFKMQSVRARLNGMLKDVTLLRDQCQHLKLAHQMQRQEVHQALVFFSQKIIAFVRQGLISEDALGASMAQDFNSFRQLEFNAGTPSSNHGNLLEATRAELLKYNDDDAKAETINVDSSVGTTNQLYPANNPQIHSLPQNVSETFHSAEGPPSSKVKRTRPLQAKPQDSTHPPDLVRTNRGEAETPRINDRNVPAKNAAGESLKEQQGMSGSEVWISVESLKRP